MNNFWALNLLLWLLWLAGFGRSLLGVLSIWQIKEYRLDRYRAHLTTSEGRLQILNGGAVIRVALAAVAFGVLGLGLWWWLAGAALIWFLGELAYTIFRWRQGKLRRPKLTTRAKIILGMAGLLLIVYFYFNFKAQFFPIGLLVIHALVWPLTTVAIFATAPIVGYLKRRLIKKAGIYRAGLKNLKMVGVTGSYGKTSTKMFLAHFLASAGLRVVSSPGNVNTDIGLARFLLTDVKASHQVCVAEMAAYRLGEIKRSAAFIRPEIGILTAINDQHLALFGSRENISRAKYELIDALPAKGGLAIFNDDNEACYDLANQTQHVKVVRYSYNHRADLYATDIRQSERGLEFVLHLKVQDLPIRAPILGTHLVSTFLAASAAALALGVTPTQIQAAASTLRVPGATMEPRRGFKGALVIDDSYSANPDGVAVALNMLKDYPARKRFVVMRPMIELGSFGAAAHRVLGQQLARSCDFALFINHDFEAEIRAGALEAGLTAERLIFDHHENRLAALLRDLVQAGDVILLENRIPGWLKDLILKL